MARRHKTSGVYSFLEKQGIIQTGDPSLITLWKKKYWNAIRAQQIKDKRKDHKCYSIYYSKKEHQQLEDAVKKVGGSITAFIKRTSLSDNGYTLKPALLGEVREMFVVHYGIVETYLGKLPLTELQVQKVLDHLLNVEEKILTVLKQ